ncbi:hypothetical protein Y032_0131g1596 [Ancylostoma ceylanicum]|uniref:Uncharacterized protein n=1 Tax=Ancylostoma ceylanicum TaxID=53326 RepID=A0A016T6X2_9BILA|nr:hypothetical protein Y032_0131g1596 [Ancylostoma ceylanicum]
MAYFCLALHELKQVGVTCGPNAPIRVAWLRPFSLTMKHTHNGPLSWIWLAKCWYRGKPTPLPGYFYSTVLRPAREAYFVA